MLAAALALSAALGGMVGRAGRRELHAGGPAPVAVAGRTGLEEIQALKENVVQARVELAAMKVSIESGHRNASAQFTRIGERIERVERLQAEPVAKLNKAIETLERLVRAETGQGRHGLDRRRAARHAAAEPGPAPSRAGWCATSSAAPR